MSVVSSANDLLGHYLSYLDLKSAIIFLSTSKKLGDKNRLVQILDFSKMTDVTFEKFRECLLKYPAVMSINVLGCVHLNDDWLKEIALRSPNLRKIDLTSSLPTDAGLKHLEGCRNLSEVTLGANEQFSPDGMVGLISKLPNLRVLAVVRCAKLDDRVLAACVNIKEISLQGLVSEITDKGLEHLKGLKKISFSFLPDSITNAGIQRVFQNSPKLKSAHFFEMPSLDEEALMTLAKSCRELTDLRLENCKRATSKGVTEVLKANPHVSLVQFWGTTPATDEWLSDMAPHCTSLKTLKTKYQGPHADRLSKRWPWVSIEFPTSVIKSSLLKQRAESLKS